MNEKYLRGYFDAYVATERPDAKYEDWASKISKNEKYKQGMFDTYVKPSRPDAQYEDWNAKVFGLGEVKKKDQSLPKPTKQFSEPSSSTQAPVPSRSATGLEKALASSPVPAGATLPSKPLTSQPQVEQVTQIQEQPVPDIEDRKSVV